MARRPHNSGHHTIESCYTSQYEQHLRAVVGLPLGDPSMKAVVKTFFGLIHYVWKVFDLTNMTIVSNSFYIFGQFLLDREDMKKWRTKSKEEMKMVFNGWHVTMKSQKQRWAANGILMADMSLFKAAGHRWGWWPILLNMEIFHMTNMLEKGNISWSLIPSNWMFWLLN